MRLEHLKLENIRSHENAELDLTGITAAAVIGANGAGKSTILRAVEWAMYGNGSADDLLRFGARTGGVTLTFVSAAGDRWRVNRGRERGKRSWLVLEQHVGGWRPVKRNTATETQEILDDVLGMDVAAFRASVYSPQGAAGALAAMTPGGRKELLGALLGLEHYETWRAQAGQEARDLSTTIAVKGELAQSLQDRIALNVVRDEDREQAQENVGVAERRIAALEQALTDTLAAQEAYAGFLRREELTTRGRQLRVERDARRANERDLKAELEKIARQAPAIRMEYEQACADEQAEHKRAAEARAAANDHARRRAEAEQRTRITLGQLSACERELDEARKALKRVKASPPADPQAHVDVCPTCQQEIRADEVRARVRAHAETLQVEWTEQVTAAEATVARREEALRTARGDHEHAQEALEAIGRAPEPYRTAWDPQTRVDAEIRLDALRRGELKAEALQLALDGARPEAELKAEYDQLRAEAKTLPERAEEPTESAETIRVQQVHAREHLAATERALRDLEQRDQENERDAAEHETITAEIGGLTVQRDALAVLERAFSRNGIPAMILDNAVDAVEQAANEALEQVGTSMRIRLATQVARRSGKGVKDSLEILVDDGAFERALETYSGGEQYRVHIALRLGLAQVLGGADMLLIDEPTDLDDAGIQMLAELLTRLDRQVLLVTHQDDLTAGMPQRIVVTKPHAVGASQLEVT